MDLKAVKVLVAKDKIKSVSLKGIKRGDERVGLKCPKASPNQLFSLSVTVVLCRGNIIYSRHIYIPHIGILICLFQFSCVVPLSALSGLLSYLMADNYYEWHSAVKN